jgi:hypothetical protein
MSRRLRSTLRRQLAAQTNQSTLEYVDVGGIKVEAFHGIPLRRCDVLAADETPLTF